MLAPTTFTLNLTENFQIVIPEQPMKINSSNLPNKTIDKLMQQQTEIIKKIVSNHKEGIIEYPIVTRKDAQVQFDPKVKETKERESIEELRRKCQELFKQTLNFKHTELNNNNTQEAPPQKLDNIIKTPIFTTKPENLEIGQLPIDFYNSSPEVPVKEKEQQNITVQKNELTQTALSENIKIIEPNVNLLKSNLIPYKAQPNVMSSVQSIPYPLQSSVHYVQLEPVVLQKMILNNGRTLLYMYKSIPAVSQNSYLPLTRFQQSISSYPDISQNAQASSSEMTQFSNTIKYASQTASNEFPQHQVQNIQEQVPKYEIEYGTTQKPDENLYKKQMKFVLPMPYPAHDGEYITKHPWQFDPFAYYPRSLQPATINIPIPYMPTFHMIRTLNIPEHLIKRNAEKVI